MTNLFQIMMSSVLFEITLNFFLVWGTSMSVDHKWGIVNWSIITEVSIITAVIIDRSVLISLLYDPPVKIDWSKKVQVPWGLDPVQWWPELGTWGPDEPFDRNWGDLNPLDDVLKSFNSIQLGQNLSWRDFELFRQGRTIKNTCTAFYNFPGIYLAIS